MAAKTKTGTANFDKTKSTHTGRFEHLLDSGMYSDIELIIGEDMESVKCHKLILMTGSPYFKNKLQADKTIKELSCPEINFDAFCKFLKFMYTGEMCEDVEYAIPLLNMAIFFEVPDLEEFCIKLVHKKLAKDNAIQILQQAVEYLRTDIISAASKIVCRYASELVGTADFLEMTTECLSELVKRDDLAIKDETQLFEALIRWAEEECKRAGTTITPKYCRSVLEHLIPHIRFPLMDPGYFSLKVAPRNILTTEEMVSVLLYYNIPAAQRAEAPPGLFNTVSRQYVLSPDAMTNIEKKEESEEEDDDMGYGLFD